MQVVVFYFVIDFRHFLLVAAPAGPVRIILTTKYSIVQKRRIFTTDKERSALTFFYYGSIENLRSLSYAEMLNIIRQHKSNEDNMTQPKSTGESFHILVGTFRTNKSKLIVLNVAGHLMNLMLSRTTSYCTKKLPSLRWPSP